MPDYTTLLPGRFLKASHLGGHPVTLTIARIDIDDVPDIADPSKSESRGVLIFSEARRGLVLNKTNADCIAAMFGRDSDAWIGKMVTLFPSRASMGREEVDAIRVMGSPELSAPIEVTVKAGKRRPITYHLVKTDAATTTPVNAVEEE